MAKTNQIKLGAILSYLQIVLSILIQLVYTPAMIRLLGTSEYGLYNTVSSTISVLGILSLGFNAGYLRYYSIYRNSNDNETIYKLNGLMLVIFFIIGLIGLFCGIFLSYHLDLVFDRGLSTEEYGIARILMLLLTANLAISFPMSVFQNIVLAHERFVILKSISMVKTVLSPLITLPLLLAGFKSVALVAVSVFLSFFSDVTILYYVLAKMHEKFVFRGFEGGLLKGIVGFTVFIALNTIIDQINWNIDKVLLARYKGTTQVAVYSVGFTLYNCYMNFSTAISGVFSPKIHRIVNETNGDPCKQEKELTEIFTKVGRVQFILLGLISTGILFFGKYFITRIWAGYEYDDSYWVALLLVFPASIALIQNIGIEIQRAENRHQFRSIAYTVMAFLNLGVSIILCQRYGAIGSAIGTAVSLLIANGIIMNIYYHKKCHINIVFFWKSIGRLAIGMIAPLVSGVLLYRTINDLSTPQFLIRVLVYIVIYFASMWFLGMNQYERNLIRVPIQKLARGKR